MVNAEQEQSVGRFYDGQEIFITGGTGYVGKVLIEKLLRSCKGIKKIYILARMREGESEQERILKMINNLLYESLKGADPDSLSKLSVIKGDVMELNLGIGDDDTETLSNCSLIFHCAASVRFDDPIRKAILLNTRGTREICLLAQKLPKLKSLVHVSTAFVQPKHLFVEEKIFEAGGDWKNFVHWAENCDESILDVLTPKLTDHAVNTYTFTKNLAEHVCKDLRKKLNLPLAIVRPSIVAFTETEPIAGWIDHVNGPSGILMLGVLGLNHISICDADAKLNFVPADLCVNGMILAAIDAHMHRQHDEVPIYNAASIKCISNGAYNENTAIVHKYPSKSIVSLPGSVLTTNVPLAWILRIIFNIIPALFFDLFLRIGGKNPRLMKIQRILFNAEQALGHFSTRTFDIVNHKFLNLNRLVSKNEENEFSIREKTSNNKLLMEQIYLVALREILKESPEDLPAARIKFKFVVIYSRAYQLAVACIVIKILCWVLATLHSAVF